MHPNSLADFTGACRPSGNEINYERCPVCGGDEWKTFLNPDTGAWICFRGSCGARGRLKVGLDPDAPGADIMRRLETNVLEPEWPEVELPEWEEPSSMALRYLAARNIGPTLAAELGMVEWVDKFRIIIPYFSESGEMIYWNSRRYNDRIGHGPKYVAAPGKHPLFLRASRSPGIWAICEGVFDAIAISEVGISAVALGGKSLPKYLRPLLLRVCKDSTILLVLDPDALAAALRLRIQLSDVCDSRIVILPDDPAGTDPAVLKERLS